MREVEFRIPKQCDLAAAEELIDRACAERGLIIGMKGSLAGYPGCIHWHYKNRGQPGTLELTLYPKERRIWAQVQDGRRAAWIDVELPQLQGAVERKLQQTRTALARKRLQTSQNPGIGRECSPTNRNGK